MPRYRTTITSTFPPEHAFDLLARFSSSEDWDPGVVEATQLTPEPLGVGSAFRVVVAAGPARLPLVYRIEAYERPHRVVLKATHPLLTSLDTITVRAAPGGSEVAYDAELTFPFPARLFGRVTQRAFDRIGDRAAAGLRAALQPAGARG